MKRILLVVTILTFLVITGRSQSGPATWYEIELNKQIMKGLNFEIVPELRFNPDFSINEYFIEGGLQYKIFKPLSIAALYRYYEEKKNKHDETGHRYIFDIKSGFEINRFEVQGRIRYIDYISSNDKDEKFPLLRYRSKLSYNIRKSGMEPFVTVEVFHDYKNKAWHKVRYTGGLKYSINKKHDVNIFYRFQDFIANEEKLHIIGLGYSLNL